jgi:hypothetical protein
VTNECANGIIQRFLDAPAATVESSCAKETVSRFTTEQDIITVPAVRSALASGGIGGLLGVGLTLAPGLVGMLLLFTALPFYAVGWLVGLIRGKRDQSPGGWTGGWSRWGPWLAVIVGAVFLAFFAGLMVAAAMTVVSNENLIGLGAIGREWRPLFYLPPLALTLVTMMCISAAGMWIGDHRSLPGRIYYSLLTVAGLAGVASLDALGVVWLWRG